MARAPLGATLRAASKINLLLRPQQFRYVFILAHRRSGSSLLAQILVTHPEFVGAGETHTSYRTPADLPKLIPRTSQLLRKLQLNGTYIVDKITMDQYLIDDKVLLSPLIQRCLILIRAPDRALRSLMDRYSFPQETALNAYANRLEMLVRYGGLLRDRGLLVEYDELLDHPEQTLAKFKRFFDVDQPFTTTYIAHKATG